MMTLILFIVFYVVPAIGAYQTFRRNYKPGGAWQYLSPNKMNACLVFTPLANIVITLLGLVDYLLETEAPSFFRLDDEDIDEEELMEEVLRKEAEAFNKWKSAHDRYRKKLQKD